MIGTKEASIKFMNINLSLKFLDVEKYVDDHAWNYAGYHGYERGKGKNELIIEVLGGCTPGKYDP